LKHQITETPIRKARQAFYSNHSKGHYGIILASLEEFRRYRERMNTRILSSQNIGIKRFFALDSRAYEKGALDPKTKELLGLVASTVLRCNDCITYHIIRCVQEAVSDDELLEALNVALIVGGSITIPHIRRAIDVLDQCREKQKKNEPVEI
jgi:AhpD family alkylhydroperoxidase